MAYIGNTPGVSSQRLTTEFSATAGQTTFTPSGGYMLGYVDVLLNGVELKAGTDFAATDGINVVLTSGAASGDEVKIKAWLPRGLSDGYLKSEADAKYALQTNPTINGNVTTTGLNFDSNTLVVDATNDRVGIGTDSPAVRLHVGGGNELVRLQNTTVSGDGAGYISFYNQAGARVGYIGNTSAATQQLVVYNQANEALRFGTNNTERMRIDSSGNVGIGTSSPSSKLGVVGSITSAANIYGTTNATAGVFRGADSTYGTYAYGSIEICSGTDAYYNGAIKFLVSTNINSTHPTERMRLDYSGNLGLGVTPSAWYSTVRAYQFSTSGALWGLANQQNILLSNNEYINSSAVSTYISTGAASRYQQDSGTHRWYQAPSGTAGDTISFTQAMTLDANGKLGLGTTSPSERLHVSSSGDVKFELQTTTSNPVGMRLRNTTRTYIVQNIDNALRFYDETGGAERIRISSSGNVGIGTESPGHKLHVKGILALEAISGSTNTWLNYTYTDNTCRWNYNGAGGDEMTLDINGNLLVGSSTTGVENANYFKMEVSNRYLRVGHSGTGNGTDYIKFDYQGNQTGGINQNSTTSVAYVTTSDHRLKENVQLMTGALAKVEALRPVTYSWKSNGEPGRRLYRP